MFSSQLTFGFSSQSCKSMSVWKVHVHADCLTVEAKTISTPLWLLVDPVEVGRLPLLNLVGLEPESNLLLRTLDAVGAVADISTNVDGVVTSDGAWVGSERVGGTKDGSAGLAGVTTFPDHGNDGTAEHV